LLDVIKRFIPGVVARRARKLEACARSLLLGAKYRCPVCNSRVNTFRQLPEFYRDNLQRYGWPYGDSQAETCNHLGYLCPYCEATNRDRLYSLYLHDYLLSLKTDSVIKIVDFAPSASLSAFIRGEIARSGKNISYRTADAFADGVDDKVDVIDTRE
jgi:hypothetical protein